MYKGRVRPSVEALERRVVPTVTLDYSTNWSGYAISTGADAVTSVSGAWKVPTATGPTQGYSATWVGIDGLTSNSVQQIGTESDYTDGSAQYYAWYEMYPNPSITINKAIEPGDQVTATVSYSSGKFTLTIDDPSWSKPYTVSVKSGAERSSAEWVVEAPSTNSVLPLADFGTETFTNASATVSKHAGPINAGSNNVEQLEMQSQSGVLEDTTSALTTSGTGFTVTYDSSGSSGHSGHGGGGGGGWWWYENNQSPPAPLALPTLGSATSSLSPQAVLASATATVNTPALVTPSAAAPNLRLASAVNNTLGAATRTPEINLPAPGMDLPAPASTPPTNQVAPAADRTENEPVSAWSLTETLTETLTEAAAPPAAVFDSADELPSTADAAVVQGGTASTAALSVVLAFAYTGLDRGDDNTDPARRRRAERI